uniref:protein FAR1-RELATED SEQUENCE 5-like n=1 Tax=Erigeron canadensis TaxID=72917 RepID=UPI001CB89D76|nr:protein FAR1-RELATED SEQUENCE 5-like [Erigeron canadensis]
MFDKHPFAIITDQDKAIVNAIKKEFPNTRHRYCSWHINKHELEHLPSLKARYPGIEEFYREWVKNDTVEEFETRWKVMSCQYKFESRSWIMDMYTQRHHWAEVFLKDCFFAGMTTSGRSDSIHSFFDGYVTSNTMLNEFVVQYDNAVKSRRKAEEDEDFRTINSRPVLSSLNPIEAKAGTRYTSNIFEDFQKEWIQATNNLTHETLTKNVEEIIYKVGQLDIEKRWTLDTRYKEDSCSIRMEDIDGESAVSALTLWRMMHCYKKREGWHANELGAVFKDHTLWRFSSF